MGDRQPPQIRTRLSAITNSFVQTIIPASPRPSEPEMAATLQQFGQIWAKRTCVYCGAPSTDFDHLRAIVARRRPSGYLNEARNLVPACGTCNKSKGNRHWRAWMLGPATKSPTTRGVTDVPQRIAALDTFEQWSSYTPSRMEAFVDSALWDSYWEKLDQIEVLIGQAQAEADRVRVQIAAGLSNAMPSQA